MKSSLRAGVLAAACFSLVPGIAFAQSQQPRGPEPHGSAFQLFGAAQMVRDPENPQNIVLQVVSDGATPAGADRELRHVKIWHLDHQLSFRRAFVAPHSCAGGSPRIILFIDADGDGQFNQAGGDFTAAGHVRPPWALCETGPATPSNDGPAPSTLLWRVEDLTDELPRWELLPPSAVTPPIGPIGGAGTANWDTLEAAISTAFPNHQVIFARFLEDFNPTPPGTSYYDLLNVLELTLGTEGQEEAPNPGPRN
jgi:hypothetical protein